MTSWFQEPHFKKHKEFKGIHSAGRGNLFHKIWSSYFLGWRPTVWAQIKGVVFQFTDSQVAVAKTERVENTSSFLKKWKLHDFSVFLKIWKSNHVKPDQIKILTWHSAHRFQTSKHRLGVRGFHPKPDVVITLDYGLKWFWQNFQIECLFWYVGWRFGARNTEQPLLR